MRISDWSSDVCSSDLRAVVEGAKAGIKAGGLARARRAGDEDDTVRLGERIQIDFVDGGRHAQSVEVDAAIVLVEDAQHHAFASAARPGIDAAVQPRAADGQADAPPRRPPPPAPAGPPPTLSPP